MQVAHSATTQPTNLEVVDAISCPAVGLKCRDRVYAIVTES